MRMSERGKKMEKSFECDDAVSRILKRMWNCRGKHTTSIDKVAMEQIIRDELSTTQKPIECDDAVSREAVIGEFKDIYKAAERWSQNATEDDIEARADAVMAILMELTLRVKDLPSVTQKSGKCKNCKYFEYDSVAKVDGIPLIVAHEICNKWGDGCKTSEDGYCYLFEPQESEARNEM